MNRPDWLVDTILWDVQLINGLIAWNDGWEIRYLCVIK